MRKLLLSSALLGAAWLLHPSHAQAAVCVANGPNNFQPAADPSGWLQVHICADDVGGGGGGGGGAVTNGQGTTPWNENLVQVGGETINLGQNVMADSFPVTIASNQSALPVTGTFFQATQPVSGTFFQATQPVSLAALPNFGSPQAVTQSGGPWSFSAASLPLPAGAATSALQPAVPSGTASTSTTLVNPSGCVVTVSQTGPGGNTVAPLSCNTFGDLRTTLIGSAGVAYPQDATTNAFGVTQFPTSNAVAGIPPVVTGALASSLALKTSAGSFFGAYVTPTVAGYLMVLNATSAPATGATVAPFECVQAAANSTTSISYPNFGEPFSTGAVVLFSTTGCLTYTASATAFIHGNVK